MCRSRCGGRRANGCTGIDLPAIDPKRPRWGTVPLVAAAWRSLWRPYWLAKRRLPTWLPLGPSRDALETL